MDKVIIKHGWEIQSFCYNFKNILFNSIDFFGILVKPINIFYSIRLTVVKKQL